MKILPKSKQVLTSSTKRTYILCRCKYICNDCGGFANYFAIRKVFFLIITEFSIQNYKYRQN